MTALSADPRAVKTQPRHCRFCASPLDKMVVDLGMSPLCERFLTADQLDAMEPFYPLRAFICEACYLVQVGEYVAPDDIFTEYAYFSSYSDSWVEHARRYAEQMRIGLALGPSSHVVELGSNDGYLLQHFAALGIPVLGIDPAENVAAAARVRGVPTIAAFFGERVAADLVQAGHRPDLIVGNNVLAQVPDINDFVAGIRTLLAPGGLVTIEVPHLLRLIQDAEFDTIYHEHFSYFSLGTAQRIFAAHGLAVVDVEELPSHGGSIRIHLRHLTQASAVAPRVAELLAREHSAGLFDYSTYATFGRRVEEVKREVLTFLIAARREGRSVVGYGAPGKANTFLNFCGIRTDLLEYTVDRNTYKHGRYTPGTHIPIHSPERIFETRPDYVWILPWNLRREVSEQMAGIRSWGGRFVVAVPRLEVIP